MERCIFAIRFFNHQRCRTIAQTDEKGVKNGMSLEYQGTPSPPLQKLQITELLDRLAVLDGWVVLRRTDEAIGLGLPPSGNHADVSELVSIFLTADQVYVAFHAGYRWHRESVLQAVNDQLTRSGATCHLQEL